MPKKVAVIDGNSLMHRAFHAVPPTMNAPDGRPTNAVFGFLSMLLKFVDVAAPDAIVCAFDAGRPKVRTEALAQYKAQRPPMDESLKTQFPIIEELLVAMNVPVVRVDGWEGDDVLGTISAEGERLGYQTLLVSGDKDVYQLTSELTRVVTTKKGITDIAVYGPKEVFERYGVTPEQFPDFLGLMGDSSDNIPGVPGIGAKTASKLLSRFGSLEGIYEHIDELKGKQKEHLVDNEQAAYLSREVATIVRDLTVECDLEQASFPSFDPKAVAEAFGEYRLNSHLARILKLVGQEPVKKSAELSWEPVMHGEDAWELLRGACEGAATVGVAFAEPEQTTLFGGEVVFAVNSSAGTAVFDGDDGLRAFADVVGRCRFASLDVKSDLHRIFPADSLSETLIGEKELFDADFFDLGLAAYVLNSSQSAYSLDALLEEYAGGCIPEAKTDADRAVLAAAASRTLVDPLVSVLRRDGSLSTYTDIDLPLVPVLAYMERTGAAIDTDRLAELGRSTGEELESLRTTIHQAAGEEFNIDSPKQLGHVLFDVLGLPAKKKTNRGYSTDASVLKELVSVHELPALVLRYRELAKIKSTYIDALPAMRASDGRVHTSFNETVTATGRLSSSNPNLQNIPVRTDFGRQIRECFVPLEQGSLFLSADYSQIELRLLAHLSADEHLVAAFNSGEDFHASTAARVFGLPVDQVTPTLRSRAKAVNFGIVYGQQAYGLSQSLDIPFGEAKNMIDRYFEAYPGVRAYLDETVNQAKENGYAETMFGRKRHIPELRASNATQRGFGERTAMNHPMQGSAADIIKLAMLEVARRLREEGFRAKLLLQVHDELDFSVPADEVDALTRMVTDVMQNVVSLRVPLVVDVSAGTTWAEAH
ncbi:DNA polymerase I [Adlercreutzia sp. ZJ138]|uniref:DNA polymerase I n=1 Tax=Adlercreutzia sp. ZJ138 TaxID=2709405 RepID=UPI0013ECD056|nr:DNA polymerase I [Adlercreutzia sp. ZJ138]